MERVKGAGSLFFIRSATANDALILLRDKNGANLHHRCLSAKRGDMCYQFHQKLQNRINRTSRRRPAMILDFRSVGLG